MDSVTHNIDSLNNMFVVNELWAIEDTAHAVSDSSVMDTTTFFTGSPVEISPLVYQPAGDQWFIYVLLFLSLGVAVIWYSIPERLTSIFSMSVKNVMGRPLEKGSPGPGIVVSVFFLLNSLITISFLLFYVLKHRVSLTFFAGFNDFEMLLLIALVLSIFTFIKLLLIRLSGSLFKTGEMAKKQQKIYVNSYNATGVLLLPLLLILLVLPGTYFLYFILGIVAIMFVYRWVQTIVIGINITHFYTFHLILYLCTLEIIPMMVLLKIFM